MLPFSPPKIYDEIIDEVIDTLRSGWITTGPKTKLFEKMLTDYNGNKSTLCLNSATAGLEIMLRWFGVEEGDEVIIPVYTYCSTANVVVHCGAKPIFVDVGEDFNINIENIKKAITSKTKVIIPVDFAGFPCDYDGINNLVNQSDFKDLFKSNNEIQEKLGRILILSDAAHSIGGSFKGNRTGSLTDVSVFSFHAVKNLTTAEGGAVALNLPEPFDNAEVYNHLCVKTLHGQNKDALAKSKKGAWRYDVIEAGYKANMTDINASLGLVELRNYADTLTRRKQIFDLYTKGFDSKGWAQIPVYETENSVTSYHLYPLRIKGIDEVQRDKIIDLIFEQEVSVNVHFQPLPMLSLYKNMGYNIADYPVAYDNYSREISLPVYYDLSNDNVQTVIKALIKAVEQVLNG
ncbi:MAG: DegT/DnrJ/EryC1/StrS aminotransferase family protein [Vicingaceae bacterium]|nr:DegT/DnrJ/EryC1/StrS aminotransferase family protein [Vicingaceae bacterium]